MWTTIAPIVLAVGTLLACSRRQMRDLDFDPLFDSLVRELVEARAAGVEMASTSRRRMADIQEEERDVAGVLWRQADQDRATFREMLDDADERSGGRDVEVAYDSADENQERQADLIARYLVALGYAEMRTEQDPPGHAIYRVRFFWGKLRREQEPREETGSDGPRSPVRWLPKQRRRVDVDSSTPSRRARGGT